MDKNEIIKKSLFHIFFITCSICMLFPFIWMVLSSFKSLEETFLIPPKLFPSQWKVGNYVYMWTNGDWGRYFLNTIIVTLSTIFGQLLVCSMSAYAFARLRFPGKNVIFLIYLSTMMVPFQVVMIPTFKIVQFFGWFDSLPSLIVPAIFNVFGTFMLRQFFLSIPKELEESAKIDGCSYPRIYSEIVLKNSTAGLITLAVLTFLATWNDFLRPLIFLNDQEKWTLSLGLAQFQGQYVTQWNEMMAGSVITIIPVLIIFLVGQKYFVTSVVSSGLKG